MVVVCAGSKRSSLCEGCWTELKRSGIAAPMLPPQTLMMPTSPLAVSCSAHRQRPHMTVHVEAAEIAGLSGAVLSELTDSGMTLDAATVERLMGDSIVTRVLMAGSVVLDVGRPSRTIPHSIRRAVIARDRHCRYGACNRPAAWADVHHIREWQAGGGHSLDNCVLLCSRHHDRMHRFGETIAMHPDDDHETADLAQQRLLSRKHPAA